MHAAQAHTELADTPGTGFRDECLTLVAEARYGELLDRWLGQFEMLLSRAQDKGTLLRGRTRPNAGSAGLGSALPVGMLGMHTTSHCTCTSAATLTM